MSALARDERPMTPEQVAEREQWRAIPGFPLYEVSDFGNIRSTRRRGARGGLKYIRTTKQGYKSVALFDGSRERSDNFVHRLVLAAFVGPRPEGMEAAHLDGDPGNNHVANLVWTTHSENLRHRIAHGTDLSGYRHRDCKLTPEMVAQIRAADRTISNRKLAKMFGVSSATIWFARNGRRFP